MPDLDQPTGRPQQHGPGNKGDTHDEFGATVPGGGGGNGAKAPSPLRKPVVRTVLVVGLVLILLGGGFWAFDWWTRGRFLQATNDAYLQADQVTVSTRVAGIVEQVLIADNQTVHAGQRLVKLDERDPRARLEQALAQVDQGRASIVQAEARIRQQDAQIQQAQAQIEQAQAAARQAQVDLDATLIRASIDGRIGDRTVQAGQYVQVGTRLMTVVPVHDLYLVANFKETQIRAMRIGQPATIDVDALDGPALHGVVDSFSPGTGAQFALIPPSNATGNFTKIVQRVAVRIRVEADAQARNVLVPGLSATVSVDTAVAAQGVQTVSQNPPGGTTDPRAPPRLFEAGRSGSEP